MSAEKLIASFLAFTQGVDIPYPLPKRKYLLRGNDTCDSITGGWELYGDSGGYAKIEDGIKIAGRYGDIPCSAACVNRVYTGDFTKLCAIVKYNFSQTYRRYVRLDTVSGISYLNTSVTRYGDDVGRDTVEETIIVDISSLEYVRPAFLACRTGSYIEISEVFLQ